MSLKINDFNEWWDLEASQKENYGMTNEQFLKLMCELAYIQGYHKALSDKVQEEYEQSKNSNCCGVPLIENTDLCSECKEHTGVSYE